MQIDRRTKDTGREGTILPIVERLDPADLAAHTQMSEAYVSRLEGGSRQNPTLKQVAAISSVLGISIDTLVTPEENSPCRQAGVSGIPPDIRQYLTSSHGISQVRALARFTASARNVQDLQRLLRDLA